MRDRLSEDSTESVMVCFDKSSPFDGLESQHFQHKYYKDHFFSTGRQMQSSSVSAIANHHHY